MEQKHKVSFGGSKTSYCRLRSIPIIGLEKSQIRMETALRILPPLLPATRRKKKEGVSHVVTELLVVRIAVVSESMRNELIEEFSLRCTAITQSVQFAELDSELRRFTFPLFPLGRTRRGKYQGGGECVSVSRPANQRKTPHTAGFSLSGLSTIAFRQTFPRKPSVAGVQFNANVASSEQLRRQRRRARAREWVKHKLAGVRIRQNERHDARERLLRWVQRIAGVVPVQHIR